MISEWKPIETAPRDGTRILLANDKLFAAGELTFSVGIDAFYDFDAWHPLNAAWEAEWGMPDPQYSSGLFKIPNPGAPPKPDVPMKPNPDAGKRSEWWHTDPPSAFKGADRQTVDNDGCYDPWEPTHWQPLPSPPEGE